MKLLFIYIIFYSSLLFCQDFEKNVFIDIPGNNYDFDLLSQDIYHSEESFITWINENDSIYTVYMKKISPEISANIVVDSDTIIKSNPKISHNPDYEGVKIAWESYSDGYYNILLRFFLDDTLGSKIIIHDSLIISPQISLSMHRLVFVENGKLFIQNIFPNLDIPVVIDSSYCLQPDIIKYDETISTNIIYGKEENGNHSVHIAFYNKLWRNPEWIFVIISDEDAMNAKFGIIGNIAFEILQDNVSKIMYSTYGFPDAIRITNNENCNYKNPCVFSYTIPVSEYPLEIGDPFFITFDTDSLENNNEVFIKTFYFELYDSLINISNLEGNDYKPKVAYMSINDTFYVSIFWLHEENSKTDIWIAKQIFNPINTAVNGNKKSITSFRLNQNYPNPFNPETRISFELPEHSTIKIYVYDILGNEITTLEDNQLSAGHYERNWKGVDASGKQVSTGVYFYRLHARGESGKEYSKVMKMVMVK